MKMTYEESTRTVSSSAALNQLESLFGFIKVHELGTAMTNEIIVSPMRLLYFSFLLVCVKLFSVGVIAMFGVDWEKAKTIINRSVTILFACVVFMTLLDSPSPALNVVLYLVPFVAIMTGFTCAEMCCKQSKTDLFTAPVKWTIFVVLVCLLSIVVGNGYPANPLAALDLVELMRSPIDALKICTITAAMGFVLKPSSASSATS